MSKRCFIYVQNADIDNLIIRNVKFVGNWITKGSMIRMDTSKTQQYQGTDQPGSNVTLGMVDIRDIINEPSTYLVTVIDDGVSGNGVRNAIATFRRSLEKGKVATRTVNVVQTNIDIKFREYGGTETITSGS